ncbi:serine/threonine-protein kinase [Actinokineospora sp. UTMC 2448]|uniref:serine/threonine-protein kinase n=1 Tax=Actinokineospora sp. UTMC 2448 TaxID=2268449 RepID=UPI002164694E|nr:serine/threonine-protein kinase [Actinokineospora sp. UTMC 2448]UVS76395.1 Serine/threonine-protein kinase PrkC [Actinokineospora sp. UTMC 2448]
MRVVAGRYEVLGELGRGGMGVVWRARDRVIGRLVALKEIRGDDQRILREAQTAGRLNDPAIVAVHDVVTEPGATYIVMELVEAPTMADLMAARALPHEQVAAIGLQVLGALETAHAAGIVHRDVKPSNIMVLPDGRAKLADFGIARALDDPGTTTKGGIMGSPGYMAPELFTGAGPSPASDLWALGATLFHAVEGRSPFQRDTTAATLHAILYDPPAHPSCGGPVAAAISGLLTRPVESRLSAHEVRALLSGQADDVTRVVPEQPTQYIDPVVPPTPQLPSWYEPEEPPRGRRKRTGLIVAGAGVLVVAAAATVVIALRPDATSGTAAPSSPASTTATSAAAPVTASSPAAASTSPSPTPTSTPATSTEAARPRTTTAVPDTGQPAPVDPPPGAEQPRRTALPLVRHNRAGSPGHFSATANVAAPAGFVREAVLGALVADAEEGTRELYACQVTGKSDWFSSVDPGCEGQQVIGFLGHIFRGPPAGVDSHPVYRCNAGADHFDSVSSTCEGKKVEFRIGYLIG